MGQEVRRNLQPNHLQIVITIITIMLIILNKGISEHCVIGSSSLLVVCYQLNPWSNSGHKGLRASRKFNVLTYLPVILSPSSVSSLRRILFFFQFNHLCDSEHWCPTHQDTQYPRKSFSSPLIKLNTNEEAL